MIDTPCILFAGGKSSRMGRDKALLPFGGFTTLTEFQYNRLKKIFSLVYISCKDKSKFSFDANFIEDAKENQTYAPTAGFISAFKNLYSESFFVLSVDSPFIEKAQIQDLIDADTPESDATIAKTEYGIQPLCGIYHRSLYPQFLTMQKENNHKLGYLLKNSKTNYIFFSDEKNFLNLNHQEEYEKALQLLNS